MLLSIGVGVLVFGVQLIAYGAISKALAKRRMYRQRLASLRTTEWTPNRAPTLYRNRLGED